GLDRHGRGAAGRDAHLDPGGRGPDCADGRPGSARRGPAVPDVPQGDGDVEPGCDEDDQPHAHELATGVRLPGVGVMRMKARRFGGSAVAVALVVGLTCPLLACSSGASRPGLEGIVDAATRDAGSTDATSDGAPVQGEAGPGDDATASSDAAGAGDTGVAPGDDGGPGDATGDDGAVFGPPPPPPACTKNAAWGTGAPLDLSTPGDDLLDALTPDELSIVWTVVNGAAKAIHYADRASTAGAFAAQSLPAGLFTNARVALSADGLRLPRADPRAPRRSQDGRAPPRATPSTPTPPLRRRRVTTTSLGSWHRGSRTAIPSSRPATRPSSTPSTAAARMAVRPTRGRPRSSVRPACAPPTRGLPGRRSRRRRVCYPRARCAGGRRASLRISRHSSSGTRSPAASGRPGWTLNRRPARSTRSSTSGPAAWPARARRAVRFFSRRGGRARSTSSARRATEMA